MSAVVPNIKWVFPAREIQSNQLQNEEKSEIHARLSKFDFRDHRKLKVRIYQCIKFQEDVQKKFQSIRNAW